MKILILGSKGMLGGDVAEALNIHKPACVDIDKLDICNLKAVLSFIENLKPEFVINCAAYTNVDACETEVSTAYAVNAIGARNLAVACNKYDSVLVHVSTDYVFDGEAGRPYVEDDFVNPLSVYGKSKLAGENFVKSLTNKYYILRTQWLYGKRGKNFVKTMQRLAAEGKSLNVVNDQFGCPTFTKDLAAAIAELITTQAYGTYHISNSGITTWYQFALDIFQLMGIDAEVSPCTTEEYPLPAHRPKYSALENANWALGGFKPLRNYKEALREYLSKEDMPKEVN